MMTGKGEPWHTKEEEKNNYESTITEFLIIMLTILTI